MSRSFFLFRLQQVDTQLNRARTRLTEIDKLLGENAELKFAQTALDTAAQVTDQRRRALTAAEDNTRSHRIKIEQNESHLYSGRVTSPKELQDLQSEVAAFKRYLETLEERQLEAMLSFEEAEEEQGTAQAYFDRVATAKSGQDAALLEEKDRLLADLAKLETERSVALVSVKAEDRALYQKLSGTRNGVAVADASGRSCGACGTTLNAALYQAARMSDQLTHCETCGRVLYVG